MDAADNEDLYTEFQRFDERITALYEKEAWKFLPKLEKLIKEKLGWRKKLQEDDYERFQSFVAWVESAYLRPSLGITDDSAWSDWNSNTRSYESDEEGDETNDS